MTATQSAKKTSVGEGLFGCAVLLAFGIYLAWPIFEKGRPASFLCLGLFVFSGVASLVADWLKKLGKGTPAQDAKRPDAARGGLGVRIASGLVSGTQKAAFWTAVGMALIWLLQLFLNFLPEQLGPDQ